MDKRQKEIWGDNRETLLQAMSNCRFWTVSDLARQTELTRSTIYEHLRTLLSIGLVTKDGSRYQLSPTLHPAETLQTDAKPVLDEIKIKWNITGYNKIIYKPGISAELEVPELYSPNNLLLSDDAKKMLQLQAYMNLTERLLTQL